MKFFLNTLFLFIGLIVTAQQVRFMDAETLEPVSFATVAFGNGWGTHADINGYFTYSSKLYPNVDTLHITAMGYKDLSVAVSEMESVYYLAKEVDQLQEVVLSVLPTGKFKVQQIRPISHAEYHQSWMQTVESEIAVLIERPDERSAHLSTLLLPINVQENVHGKKIDVRPFSTMMRVKFYENENGQPGREFAANQIVFVVNQTHTDAIYTLDIAEHKILLPKNGLFVSLQVLGPSDVENQLIHTHTYNEIETKQGIRRVAISFRPLLPMTEKINGDKTYFRRVFLQDRQWYLFNTKNYPNSSLLKQGYNNYGLGARLHVYQND